MTGHTSARPIGHVRRRSATVRRRSAGLTATRAGAGLAMLASAAAIWGLATSPVFGLDRLTVQGAALTTNAAISSTIHVAEGTNLVTLDTAILGAALEQLPTVASAQVTAGLPGSLTVRITERRPILAWSVGQRRFLVDVDGMVIAELPAGADLPRLDRHGDVVTGGAAGTAGEPIGQVADRRQAGRALAVGDRLNAIDLDAARRLGSLTAADLGSDAGALAVRVNDKDGFVIAASGGARWTAMFGFYTPTLRSPELIPAQVRLLRSLLATGEAGVGRVTLASGTDGTYVALPSPSPAPAASATP